MSPNKQAQPERKGFMVNQTEPNQDVLWLLSELSAVTARAERAEEMLRDVHDYHCGCARPGDHKFCVAQPVVLFAALAEGST